MRTFFGMILGALLLVAGVYVYDSMNTSSVANGQVAQNSRTIVNWDVAATASPRSALVTPKPAFGRRRMRGEVGIQAELEFRVRGTLRKRDACH